MKLDPIRPEDRRRSGVDSQAHLGWADTRPVNFRSEAFAEDLTLPRPVASPVDRRVAPAAPRWRMLAGVLDALGR